MEMDMMKNIERIVARVVKRELRKNDKIEICTEIMEDDLNELQETVRDIISSDERVSFF